MDKRYQIFVSSTFEDLKEERKKIIEEILNFSHIPTGMENFTASHDEQFEYIKKILQTCDYYVLVVGGRYGSVNPNTGISYTEQEYNYALELGLPVLAFVHEKPFDLPYEKRDDDNRKAFEAFLGRVKSGRLVKYWNSIDKLIADVIISLNHAFNNNPQSGWIRGGDNNNSELLGQLNDLRIEKEKLESELARMKEEQITSSVKFDNLAEMSEVYTIKGSVDSEEKEYDFTWDQIFMSVAPEIQVTEMVIEYFYQLLQSNLGDGFSYIDSKNLQTIKYQLYAQGLILLDAGNGNEWVSLTSKGEEYLIGLMTVKTKYR